LDEALERLQDTEVVIITAYLSRKICMQADQLAEYGNTVSILLLAEEFEDDVRPETAELYVLSDKLNNLNSGEVVGI
jgi:thymidine kinase